jgi:hypothetical protein
MTTLVDIANTALFRCSAKANLVSLTDGSPSATVCNLLIDSVIGSALVAYPWRFAQRVAALAANAASTNPLWPYEFAKPGDSLKVLGVIDPARPVASYDHRLELFQQGTQFDEGYGATGPVLWTFLAAASAIYTTSDLTPDQWPGAFQDVITWSLASEIALPLTANAEIAAQCRQGAAQAMQTAMMQDQPRRIQGTDYVPSWMAVRGMGPEFDERRITSTTETFPSGFVQDLDAVAASQAAGPAYLTPADTLNGVPNAGIPAAAIEAGRRGGYVPASTPDGRIGVLAIGSSPVGWRRPYHNAITMGATPGAGETEETT